MPALFVDEQRQQSLLGHAGHGPLVLVDAARLAGEYKNLEIVFADLEQIGSHKSFEVFEAEYLQARARLEKANAEAYTAPEWCFRWVRKKIMAGQYSLVEEK